jgi:hypothetical protein
MGISTDFVGHIDIKPPLNDSEIAYLSAFSTSRRYDRGDPYEVPGNPGAESGAGEGDRYNRPGPGQPNLWCDWAVCWDGCCITWSGKEKSYSMEPWLRYVIDHFLKTGGHAASDPRFEDFTFDHVLSGTVVGCRRDNKELFAIRVEDNEGRSEVRRLPALALRGPDRPGGRRRAPSPSPTPAGGVLEGGPACPPDSMIKV